MRQTDIDIDGAISVKRLMKPLMAAYCTFLVEQTAWRHSEHMKLKYPQKSMKCSSGEYLQ
jgi:hypothetical protein